MKLLDFGYEIVSFLFDVFIYSLVL
jgi:hypothetical protein